MSLDDYNKEPVYWCKCCLSLNVRILKDRGLFVEYCGNCNSMDVEEGSIEEWKEVYAKRYGSKDIINKNNNKIYSNGREAR